jgi:GT2 family glycosyltransferase
VEGIGVKPLSVIVPTYCRERLLVDTLRQLGALVRPGDEIIVVDQTPRHEPETTQVLREMAQAGAIRYFTRSVPSQNEAMNAAAQLARNDILLFLDDDIVPSESLLEAHRRELGADGGPLATCGQVLQPWHDKPVEQVADFDLHFDCGYAHSCWTRYLIGANFGVRRDTYLALGGMDENFTGSNYRNDTEMAYRVCAATGTRVRFVADASLRHLLAQGGNRAFGAKDTWGHIGGSIGDYYFALKWLRGGERVRHIATRLVRAPLNRHTIRRPWLVLSLFVRELVALARAAAKRRHAWRMRPLRDYGLVGTGEPVAGHG